MELTSYFGSIDLTRLGQIVRQHPELVKYANMKDGTQHKFLNIDINPRQQTDQFNNVAYIRVSCKKENQRQGLNYYCADLKQSQKQQSATPTTSSSQEPTTKSDDLPF